MTITDSIILEQMILYGVIIVDGAEVHK